MKFSTVLCAAVIFSLPMTQIAKADDVVGVRQTLAPSKERGVNLDVTVWYPAHAGGEQVLLGDNRFFIGTHARRACAGSGLDCSTLGPAGIYRRSP